MEAAAVSVAHGAMGSLLAKLAELLTAKYKLLKEAKGQVMFLKAELESMYAFLKKISDMEDPDEQDKCWAKEVRELSYDIEDSVTEFTLRVERKSGSKPHGFKEFISRSVKLLTTMNTRHEIAKEFEGLKIRVKEVSERRARYKIDDNSKPSNTTVDLRILALHAETASLVGVTGPRDDLIELMDEEGVPAHQLKVLSIVGFGGLGKTTLANEIYRKIEGQFQCRAFVSVSQKPNIRKILRTVLSKVRFVPPENTNMELWEDSELISTLHKFLLDKRYLIVVDDIWEDHVWYIIKCGLPENNNGSRVITTTRIETVAGACCGNQSKYIHKMKPLSDHDSRRLFLKRIFSSQDACPPHLEEVSTGILKRCGGLPLAIITIASLLASQPNKLKQQWEYVQNSLGSNFEVNPSLDGMRQILNLSYINLPHHLKACMLYLGIYPEDRTIDRDGLLRQWIAEGFIGKHHGIDSVDIARSYFNELVNRNMIQPVDTDYNGDVVTCRVHDMMLDLMQHISREENFITVIDDDIQDLTRQLSKIRRLSFSLDGAIDDIVAESVQLSQTRMLARFGTSAYFPPLLLFKKLQVLTIEISDGPLLDLNGICHLFLLRYIKIIASGRGVVLPRKIGSLQQLESFEIDAVINSSKGQSLQELPSDIVHLSRLLHLVVQSRVNFPAGIGNMKSLNTLHFFNLTIKSAEAIKGLGELTNLTDLRINCDGMKSDEVILVERGMEVLRTCLEKLYKLKYLAVWFYFCNNLVVYLDPLSLIPASLCHLERFIGHIFSSVPGWLGKLCSLGDLVLGVNEVLEDDIRILAELPSLIYLQLHIWGTPKNMILIRRGGFPVLKSFTVSCNRMSCLALEAGAMGKLERLELCFNAKGWDRYGGVPAGMEHLSSLKEISVDIGGRGATESNGRAAESAVWKAIDLHPGRPVGRVKVEASSSYLFYGTDGKPDEEEDVDCGWWEWEQY